MREAAPSLSAVRRRLKERGVNLNDMELPCQQISPVVECFGFSLSSGHGSLQSPTMF